MSTQASSSTKELAEVLADGSALLESSKETKFSNFEAVLKERLKVYYSRRNDSESLASLVNLQTMEHIELQVATEALTTIQRVQAIVDVTIDESEPPLLGTRDLAKIRTLLSLLSVWGLSNLYARVCQVLPGSSNPGSRRIVDVPSDIRKDYELLSDFTKSVLALILPEGAQGRISQTHITTTILSQHAKEILMPALTLGYLPQNQATESTPVIHELRPLVVRMLKLLTPAQSISALTSILGSPNPVPPTHTRTTCSRLLAQQLLRPHGVQGLLVALSDDDDNGEGEIPLNKLQPIARLLNSVPHGMKAEEYFCNVIPRVLHLLTKTPRPSHKRAAAFIIHHALVQDKPGQSLDIASKCVLAFLQGPFLELSPEISLPDTAVSRKFFTPREALDALVLLFANAEPSPILISTVLSPLIPSLYDLYFDMSRLKTADPHLKESVLDLLKSWGKIVELVEGEAVLWKIIESRKVWDWKFDLEGNLSKATSEEKETKELLMPQEKDSQEEPGDIDLNLFDFYPDPVHFVETLKHFERGDLASSLFVKLLEKYRDMKNTPDEDTMRVLHKLQIIMQMQQRLAEGTTANILRKPDKLLPFIFHVLSTAQVFPGDYERLERNGEDELDEGDSDDEDAGPQVVGPDDELIETTVTLLLSILEADETLSVATHPILNDIFSLLEPISTKANDSLRPLAREARLVMTARLAGSSSKAKRKNKAEDDAQEIYQRALKLLQDPILPVRAHGLLLLRELLGPTYSKKGVNKALLPSILSIFLQSVQDEDSYIFLNAVHGLALLAGRFGKDIIQGLLRDYIGGLDGLGASVITQQDIDTRTRIGEALSLVIKKSGTTLGIYVDMIAPRLFATVKNRDVPSVLRVSSLSLLGDCVNTYAIAMLPYVQDYTLGLLDLLQLEAHVTEELPRSKRKGQKQEDASASTASSSSSSSKPTEPDPTSKSLKYAPLRRAALNFISLLIKSSTKLVYERSSGDRTAVFPRSAVQTAYTTLGYISSTDVDNVVQVMAREARENLIELQKAEIGL